MKRTAVALLVVVLGLLQLDSSRAAETPVPNWNQFRGPQGDGISISRNLPVEFSETKNVRWKVPVPGVGWSSPVTWGSQVWVTSGIQGGRQLLAVCFDLETGKTLYRIKVFDVANPGMEWTNQNPHASPTPFVEEGRIYVHYGSYGTACIDTASGKLLWKRQDLKCNHRVGPASSPVAEGQSLFLQLDGVDVQYVVALDKETGKTRWQTKRQVTSDLATRLRDAGLSEEAIRGTINKKPGDNRKSYATPTLVAVDGKQQLIAPGAEVLFSYDPQTGKELWRVDLEGWCWNVACRPVVANGLVYVTTGIAKELKAIRLGGRGNVTESHVSWTRRKSVPNMSSPLLVDGRLFMVTDSGGVVTSMNAVTGEEIWKKRLRPSGDHWASPLLANDTIYFCSKTGDVTVIEAGETYRGVASNRLDASFIASPAVAGDSLILRSTTHLYCLAKGYQRSAEQVAAERRAAEARAAYKNTVTQQKKSVGKQAGKSRQDWEKAYQQLLKTNAALREKVESGGATKEQVIAWMKQRETGTNGKAGKGTGGKGTAGKGKGEAKSGGITNFYAIVIGRLKTKDIELGEFTMEVDHVTSMYGSRWVKDEIVGKEVKVTGVSGAFRDQLLQIKRGETMKVRSGKYIPTGKEHQLTFAPKFHVLERAKPFKPADYGVPPKEFRGFQGVLEGKIVEVGGYEVTLRVAFVKKEKEDSQATRAEAITGKLVRLTGFYNQHEKAFKDLNIGDVIRVGARHANPSHDEFGVTEVLEKVE